MKTTISQQQARELFDIPEVYLYVCDGDVPTCAKSFCCYNGSGECQHTSDKEHARYAEHDFDSFDRLPSHSNGQAAVICVEPVRE